MGMKDQDGGREIARDDQTARPITEIRTTIPFLPAFLPQPERICQEHQIELITEKVVQDGRETIVTILRLPEGTVAKPVQYVTLTAQSRIMLPDKYIFYESYDTHRKTSLLAFASDEFPEDGHNNLPRR